MFRNISTITITILLHFKIKRTNEDDNPFTVFWLQLLCELCGQEVVILLILKSMQKITCLIQGLSQWGAMGPPLST